MKEVVEFASALQLAAKTLQIYTAEHPKTAEAIAALGKTVAVVVANGRVSISSTKETLLVDHEPVTPVTPHVKSLAADLEKRQISGIVINPGVERAELLALARLLALKPEQVRAQGGPDEILRSAAVLNIRTAQLRYEAVSDDEEVVSSKRVRRGALEAAEAQPLTVPELLQRYLLSRLKPAGGEAGDATGAAPSGDAVAPETGMDVNDGSVATDSGSGVGATGSGAGAAEGNPGGGTPGAAGASDDFATMLAAALRADGSGEPTPERAKQLLRASMEGLDKIAQVALLVSVGQLPESAERTALKQAADELLGELGGGRQPVRGVRDGDAIAALVRALDINAEYEEMSARLAHLGVTRDHLDDVLAVVGWDRLTLDERIQEASSGTAIFEVPAERVMRLFRELMAKGRYKELLQIVEHYSRGFDHPSSMVRRGIYDNLGQLVRMPEVPRDVEQVIGRAVLNQFVRDGDERMRRPVTESTANFLMALAMSSRCDVALRIVERFDAAAAVAPPGATIRNAVTGLEDALGRDSHASALLNLIVSTDPETLTGSVLPFIGRFGRTLSPHLIEALGTEEDRSKRGRIVRALKTIGTPAFPSILAALADETWYVVRNALNVLADVGTRDHVRDIVRTLENPDPRVRRAAVRTLGRIGGPDAEAALLSALDERNVEVAVETLLALGATRSSAAIPPVSELARGRLLGSDDKVREAAISALGQIGSDDAVPVLAEIIKPKGLFARESAEMRTAAAKSLGALGTPAAKDALRAAAGGESDRALRDLMTRLAT